MSLRAPTIRRRLPGRTTTSVTLFCMGTSGKHHFPVHFLYLLSLIWRFDQVLPDDRQTLMNSVCPIDDAIFLISRLVRLQFQNISPRNAKRIFAHRPATSSSRYAAHEASIDSQLIKIYWLCFGKETSNSICVCAYVCVTFLIILTVIVINKG